jgi:hypothetical protein
VRIAKALLWIIVWFAIAAAATWIWIGVARSL